MAGNSPTLTYIKIIWNHIHKGLKVDNGSKCKTLNQGLIFFFFERNKYYPSENRDCLFRVGYGKDVSHAHLDLVPRQAEEWENFIWKKKKEDFKYVWGLMECRAGGGHLTGLVLGLYSAFLVFLSWSVGVIISKEMTIIDQVLTVLGWLLQSL